jgi:hypothetical protein
VVKNARIAKSRIRKLIADFGGGTSLTNSLDGIPKAAGAQLLGEVQLSSDEEPLLASFLDPNRWALLTTERLIWKTGEEVVSRGWVEVQDADPPESVWRGTQQRDKIDQLIMVTSDGTRHELAVEPGLRTFDLMWNAILMLAGGKR